jgi:tetratricopeptide (TPR) repeat protein
MRFLILLILAVLPASAIYLTLYHLKRIDWKLFKISALLGIIIIALFATLLFRFTGSQKGWCERFHQSTNYPPIETRTATDYFEKGNYQYDIGDCTGALESYTKSIELNSKYPESYNNRAYTYMMLQDYDRAIPDLDKALELNPNYVNALMNRADVLNYRKEDNEAALRDYRKIIELTGSTSTAVCAHMVDASSDKGILYLLKMPFTIINCRSGNF